MKIPTFVTSAVLVSLLAVSRSEVIAEPDNAVTPYSVIDPIIKAILEAMRPKLANLRPDDINEKVSTPELNATVSVKNILIQNVDTFVINILKSTVVPLRLTNLTLTWDRVMASAAYDVDASVAIPKLNAPVRVYGKGDARASLSGIYVTVGANMEMKGKAVQIKPRGLFGFDVKINNANVSLSSLMGSTELGKAIGEFIGRIVPDLVDALKNPIFDAFQDTIIDVINEVLKNHGSLFLDEEIDLPELSFGEELEFDEDTDETNVNEELDLLPEFEETEFENAEFECEA